ncbi:MAG: hypothetical protein MUE98_08310 [Rhodobacteraceae bacterium]|jgi:hypothetical protein|nr:hypothetical protein [Paracoccaceae bacterium]
MRQTQAPLFLERQSYRRRRLADAARMLPVLGTMLILLPLLWAPQSTPGTDTAQGGLYIFLVWGGLIAAAFLMARRLGAGIEPPDDPQGGDREGG